MRRIKGFCGVCISFLWFIQTSSFAEGVVIKSEITANDPALSHVVAMDVSDQGNVLLAGQANSAPWAKMVDKSGLPIWEYRYGESGSARNQSEFKRIFSLPNGDVILCGNAPAKTYPLLNGILIRLNSNGQKVWENRIPLFEESGAPSDNVFDCEIFDGNIYVVGKARGPNIFAAEVDQGGTILHEVEIPLSENFGLGFGVGIFGANINLSRGSLYFIVNNTTRTELFDIDGLWRNLKSADLDGLYFMIGAQSGINLMGRRRGEEDFEIINFSDDFSAIQRRSGKYPKDFGIENVFRLNDGRFIVFGTSVHGTHIKTGFALLGDELQAQSVSNFDSHEMQERRFNYAIKMIDSDVFLTARSLIEIDGDGERYNPTPLGVIVVDKIEIKR